MQAARVQIDGRGVIVGADASAAAMFGLGDGELAGRSVRALVTAGDALLETLAALAPRAEQELKLEGRRVNGVPFILDATVRATDAGGERRVECLLVERDRRALATDAQRYFDAAFDNAPIGMALLNPDGEYVRVNPVLCAMLGRPAEELIGMRDQELTHPADRAADVEAAWRILRGELSTHQCEKRFVRADGEVVWALANLTFLRDEDGRALGWVGQFQDITARRAAEQAQRESEQRYRLVIRNLPGAAVAVYDHELRCRLIEGRHLADAGVDTFGMVGRRMHEILPPELVEALEPAARQALEGGAEGIEVLSPLSGRTIAAQVVPHRDYASGLTGVLVVIRDVTDQRAAERATREAERQFEVVFDRAPIGMVIVGLGGRLERANDALCRLTGYDRAALRAMEPFDVVHPDDRERVRAAFAGFAAATDDVTLEHRCLHANGATIWVRTVATLIRGDDGAPLHALAQIEDVTDRRSRDAELRRLAEQDPLTGLANRRAFRQALDDRLARVRRAGATGCVLMVDLDGFKAVNDRDGHQAGDELLIACGRALHSRLRETDTLARLGGDEFAVLLPAGGAEQARAVAAALVDVIRTARGAGGARITASVGAAVVGESDGADQLMARADRAMYVAKDGGRNRYVVDSRSGDV